MQSRILYTEGNGKSNEGSIDIADINPNRLEELKRLVYAEVILT